MNLMTCNMIMKLLHYLASLSEYCHIQSKPSSKILLEIRQLAISRLITGPQIRKNLSNITRRDEFRREHWEMLNGTCDRLYVKIFTL